MYMANVYIQYLHRDTVSPCLLSASLMCKSGTEPHRGFDDEAGMFSSRGEEGGGGGRERNTRTLRTIVVESCCSYIVSSRVTILTPRPKATRTGLRIDPTADKVHTRGHVPPPKGDGGEGGREGRAIYYCVLLSCGCCSGYLAGDVC